MSRIKNPVEKKRMAYQRDHVTLAEYPHAFRRNWPRKKARAEQAVRRTVRQLLRIGDADRVAGVRRRRVRKSGIVTLKEFVELKQEFRRRMQGARQARRARRSAADVSPSPA